MNSNLTAALQEMLEELLTNGSQNNLLLSVAQGKVEELQNKINSQTDGLIVELLNEKLLQYETEVKLLKARISSETSNVEKLRNDFNIEAFAVKIKESMSEKLESLRDKLSVGRYKLSKGVNSPIVIYIDYSSESITLYDSYMDVLKTYTMDEAVKILEQKRKTSVDTVSALCKLVGIYLNKVGQFNTSHVIKLTV